MSWHALDAFDDAIAATRGFLFPFELSRWWRLVVVVFFLGGGGGLNALTNVPSNAPSNVPDASSIPTTPSVAGTGTDAAVVAILAVAVALALAFAVLSQTMRFVLVDAIDRDEVRLRRVGARLVDGLRLLVFTAGVYLLLAAVAAGVVFAVDVTAVLDRVGAAGILVGVVALVAAVVALTALFHFTNELVVPTMVARDCGVLPAWGRFAGRLRAQPGQFLLYLVVRGFVNVGVGIVLGLLMAILGGIVVLVGAVAGGGVVLALGGTEATLNSTAGLALVALVAFVTVLVLVVGVVLPLQVFGRTFTTTYALSVLGRADPDAALLPDGGWHEGDDGETDSRGLADVEDADAGTTTGELIDEAESAERASDARSESTVSDGLTDQDTADDDATDAAGDESDADDEESDDDSEDEFGGFEFGGT
ncbi:MAG: hypothetical protein ABEJ79_04890 [Halolamina sp.]